MRIACLGGGPAGLSFAISMKLRDPSHEVDLFERNRPDDTFWFGTHKAFDAFTFAFEQTEAGWVWAHAYRFDDDFSTFIVEMEPDTWGTLGFDRMNQPEGAGLSRRARAAALSRRPGPARPQFEARG